MCLVPRGAGRTLGLGQRGAELRLGALQVREPRGARPLARPGLLQPAVGVLDGGPERQAAPREVNLLPAPQLLAQPAVAARPGRLPLERPALLLDLEDDVVDAGQVLLRGLELQLGRPAPRLVLRDAGRLLEELPALRRARAQDLTDPPLLDDRVRLDADAGIHEEVLHVAEAADLSVDEVLALPGAVQPPPDLDVPLDEGCVEIVVRRRRASRPRRDRRPRQSRRGLRRRGSAAPSIPVRETVAVAAPAGRRRPRRRCRVPRRPPSRCRRPPLPLRRSAEESPAAPDRSAPPARRRRRTGASAPRRQRSDGARHSRRRSRPPSAPRGGSGRSARRAPT